MYKIKAICVYFFQEWIEWKRRVVNICTSTRLKTPSGWKLIIIILTNIQNVEYGKIPAKVAEAISWNKPLVEIIYHMDFKSPYIRYPQKGNK